MSKNNFFGSIFFKTIVLAIIIFGVFIVAVSSFLSLTTQHNKEIIVPDFGNMTFEQASHIAAAAELQVIIDDSVYVKKLQPGVVYLQNPKAGSSVKKGRKIRLTTNTLAPKNVSMPALIGCTLRQAKAELIRNGLVLGEISYIRDIATNIVICQKIGDQDIENSSAVETGAVVNLVLGMNPRDSIVVVPNIIGQNYQKALDMLQDASLNMSKASFDNTVKDYADSLNAKVFSQRPMPYTNDRVKRGSYISISLTTNEKKIPVIEKPVLESEEALADSLYFDEEVYD